MSKVVEPDKLMDAALELAREIAKNGPVGVAQAKFAINYGSEASPAWRCRSSRRPTK